MNDSVKSGVRPLGVVETTTLLLAIANLGLQGKEVYTMTLISDRLNHVLQLLKLVSYSYNIVKNCRHYCMGSRNGIE